MASGCEVARSRPDSFDALVERPAELDAIGDPTGLSVLDVGCGNGGKALEPASRPSAIPHKQAQLDRYGGILVFRLVAV